MSFHLNHPSRALLAVCAAALFSAAPYSLVQKTAFGLPQLKASMAFAGNGSDDAGSNDHGGDRGDNHDANDDRRNHDNHDEVGDDDGSNDQAGGEDTIGGGGGEIGGDALTVVKFESSALGMEIVYSDGSREQIENGRYERKNAANRTVEERVATQSDVDRLWALR